MRKPVFTVDWFSHNIPLWQEILAPYKGQPGVRVLEIGSFEGLSTVWLLENILTHPTARIDCIDTFEGSVEHRRMGLNLDNLMNRFLRNIEPYEKKVTCFPGQSREILRDRRLNPFRYDVIYIDGSHRAADVLEDAVLSFRLLKVGGLMVFDDYAWDGGGPRESDNPKRGVDAFYHVYQDQLAVEHISYQAIYRRVTERSVESMPARLGAREMVEQLVG